MDEAAEDIEWPIGMAVMLLILLITGTTSHMTPAATRSMFFCLPLYP